MKKIYYLICCVLAVNLACTEKKAETNNDAAEEIVIDTFYSPDWAFAELRGKVKECKITMCDVQFADSDYVATDESAVTTTTLRFNEQGSLTDMINDVVFMGEKVESMSYNFEYDADGKFQRAGSSLGGMLRIGRGPGGLVNSFACIGAGGEVEFVKGYTWDGNLLTSEFIVNKEYQNENAAKIAPEVDNKVEYSYDDNGYRVAATETFGSRKIEYTVTATTYDNLKFDRHGNWTRRIIKKKAERNEVDPSGNTEMVETVTSTLEETREITYFGEEPAVEDSEK